MEGAGYKILLVDDEIDIIDMIRYNLEKEGYEVQSVHDGRSAVNAALNFQPHLVLLDVMMPGMDGMETCVEMRNHPELKHIIIALLTARAEDYSQIAGFESGADDYITKPIKPRVLLSRIKALLRRLDEGQETGIEEIAGLKIDRERYLVIQDGNELSLPKKEFELLALLASKPGKVFTREHILNEVWGQEIIVGDRTIDVHIRKLREKLGDSCIKTIKGVGYKIEVNEG